MKTEFFALGLSLTEGQKSTLAKAARDDTGATIQLTHGPLRGERPRRSHLEDCRRRWLGATVHQNATYVENGRNPSARGCTPGDFRWVVRGRCLGWWRRRCAKVVQSKQTNDAALADAGRHNRELEDQLFGCWLHLGRETRRGCCPMCKASCLVLGQKD